MLEAFQNRAIFHEIQVKWSAVEPGKEEFLIETHELKMQLGECSEKIGVLRKQKSEVCDQISDHVAERPVTEMSKLMVEIAVLESSTLEVKEEEKMKNLCLF